MMQPGAYDPMAALAVFRSLDPCDLMEAQAIRGMGAGYAQLFAEWHAAQAGAVLSLVLRWHGQPFALLVLGNTGQAGVAQAAMLARDHTQWRAGIVAAARRIRQNMPEFCAKAGVHRIEARAWAGHPRAGHFLRLCGFHVEAIMPGFGASGGETFQQYAWTANPKEEDPCVS
ncbi:hypothetical protein [Pararhodobacter sp.]|uniref:hypothetical protein n=1 Tax=Pararhodobacter sp. TaxID=2127056 RepID=UPI002FDE6250